MVSTAPARPRGPARLHRPAVLAALAVVVLAAAALSIAVGTRPLAPGQVWAALLGSADGPAASIVRPMRVPRTVLGLMVGAALGAAGALMQGHTRNPLAEPGLLGVNAGAAFAVVVAIYLLRIDVPLHYAGFALIGAAITAVVVFGLSAIGAGGSDPLSLVLAGAAVSAFLAAATTAVVLIDVTSMDRMRFWVVGSLAGRGPELIAAVGPLLALGLLLAVANAPSLNLLGMGEEVAHALGVHVGRSRTVGVVAITLLVGGATAACGPIAFLGLIVPHLARTMTGPDYRWAVPASALTGAALLLICDTIGRVLVPYGEIQVGIVLAVIGAPFFIALVRRRRLVAL